MKYIKKLPGNGFDLLPYEDYIEHNIDRFPRGAAKFLKNKSIYEPYSDVWMHDAKLVFMNLSNNFCKIKIKCRSGKYILFNYEDLIKVKVRRFGDGSTSFNELRFAEILFLEDRKIIKHEFDFFCKSKIIFEAKDLLYKVK